MNDKMWWIPVFEEAEMSSEGSKSPKNGPKMKDLGFRQQFYLLRYSFLLQYKSANKVQI